MARRWSSNWILKKISECKNSKLNDGLETKKSAKVLFRVSPFLFSSVWSLMMMLQKCMLIQFLFLKWIVFVSFLEQPSPKYRGNICFVVCLLIACFYLSRGVSNSSKINLSLICCQIHSNLVKHDSASSSSLQMESEAWSHQAWLHWSC